MKIVEYLLKQMTIEEFADAHNLIMEVYEGDSFVGSSTKFYAKFRDIEIKEGAILRDGFGNGATKEEAIRDYARVISGKLLVENAYQSNRKEVYCPKLKEGK